MIENAERRTSLKSGFFERVFVDLFEVDIRSLALFRIALGSLVLVDLANRIFDLDLFLSDDGILTGEMAQAYVQGDGFWSLYWIDGSAGFTLALFGLTVVAAVGFLIGFKTRLMNILCLVLIASLQLANPLLLTGGHILMRVMMFWSMFLPMGAVWSVDSRIAGDREPETYRVASVATMAIMLQLAAIYFFSGIAKLNDCWFSGAAVEAVLGLEMYVKPLGRTLRQYPGLLEVVTYGVFVTEIVGPILMFVPRINKFFRGMVMALFWLMHIGIWLTMSIGIFSLMAIASWLVFVPTQFWEFWNPFESSDPPRIGGAQSPRQLIASVFCGLALIYVLVLNVANIDKDESRWFLSTWSIVGNATLTVQEFVLFGRPSNDNPEFEYRAILKNGKSTDIFASLYGKTKSRTRSTYDYFPSQHWRRFHSNLLTGPNQSVPPIVARIRDRLLDKIVRKWNDSHDASSHVVSARLLCNHRPVHSEGPKYSPSQEVWSVWNSDERVE